MTTRPSRPLNSNAVRAADADIYAAHANDPRPNALYDDNGNKTALNPNDPKQSSLRNEWLKSYERHGGKMEKVEPKGKKKPNKAVEPCPEKLGSLHVSVVFHPIPTPAQDVEVTIEGPTKLTKALDSAGKASFEEIPLGHYSISAKYTKKDALVDKAMGYVGSTDWAYSKAKATHPANSNKCNLGVYEFGVMTGRSMPTHTYFSVRNFGNKTVPLLAGQWADLKRIVSGWPIVSDPQPGDIIAWSHQYADASGHVGIVAYPETIETYSEQVTAGASTSTEIKMRRTTITAEEDAIEHGQYKFWHFYDEAKADEVSKIVFRRYTP